MKQVKLDKSHFLSKTDCLDAYLFIINYHKYNSELRAYIRTLLFEKFEEIKNNSTINEESKRLLLSKIQFEILAKIMEQIEDLAGLTNAINLGIKDLKSNMVGFYNPESWLKTLSKKGQKFYFKLFNYPKISELKNLDKREKRLVLEVYKKNYLIIKQFIKFTYLFYKKNNKFYNKNKHCAPIFYGLPCTIHGIFGMSSVSIRDKNKKEITLGFYHTYQMIKDYNSLSNTLMSMTKDILFAQIHCMETSGHKQILHTIYFDLNMELKSILNNIINKHNKNIIRDNIKPSIKITVTGKNLNKFFSIYKNEFNKIMVESKDSVKIISLAKELNFLS